MPKKTKVEFLTPAQTQDYKKFFFDWRGYEFRRKGKAVPKFEVWLMYGRREGYDLIFDINQKPGWDDGNLKHPTLYDEYLQTVKFS